MASIYTYNILSPTTSGTDVNLVNSNLRITGAPPVSLKQATVSQFLDPVTELRERVTLTPTTAAAAGVVYSIRIQQVNKGRNISKAFSYTSVGLDTDTIISTRFVSMINLDPELSVVAAVAGTTFTITAASTGVDINVTIINSGTGLTQATTFYNSAGTQVTLANATATSQTSAGNVGNVGTITAASSNLANGMIVRYTLIAGDSFTFADGTVVNTVGAKVDLRVGNVSGAAFDIGQVHDSNIELFTLAATAARTLELVPSFVRGTGAELANRGIVGATSATVYAEVKMNWLEVPPNGGAAISKSHSVFVDTTTSANYNPFRFKAINLMRATSGATVTTAFQTTATNEASSVL